MAEPTGSAPAGGMPAGGGMPSAGPGEAPWLSPGVVSDAVAQSGEMPDEGEGADEEAAGAPQPAPTGAGAPAAEGAPAGPAYPVSQQQTEIVQAAQQYIVAAQAIQQEYPAVAAEKRALESQLAPFAQNPALLEQLPPDAQYALRQGYARWQQLSQREQQLGQGWQQIQRDAPQLQAMYQVEQQRALLNKVGEPVAYQLLAQRAAQRSGDPDFPVAEMTEFLRGIPPNILEQQAAKFETLVKNSRRRERAAGMVDAMGPGSGSVAGGRSGYKPGRDLIREGISDELRRRPPR
jgi:hypothetical protein